jgi:hypothetical protein
LVDRLCLSLIDHRERRSRDAKDEPASVGTFPRRFHDEPYFVAVKGGGGIEVLSGDGDPQFVNVFHRSSVS